MILMFVEISGVECVASAYFLLSLYNMLILYTV
jgi:hypothetical protein